MVGRRNSVFSAMPSICIIEFRCGTNSVVECDLAKVEVAGSNPVSRSFLQQLGFSEFTVLPHFYSVKLIDEGGRECFDSLAPAFH